MSQLKMEKTDLDAVPDLPVPPGYILRTYQEGDEAALAHIYEASRLGTETPEKVRERMVSAPCFTPGRLFVIEQGGAPVGTSAAWVEAREPDAGYLHMVGLLPEHRGKRLGVLLTVAAIRYTRSEGFSIQRLLTDDWREPAVRMYLDLGYRPIYEDDTHPGRWAALATKLDRTPALARARDARMLQQFR